MNSSVKTIRTRTPSRRYARIPFGTRRVLASLIALLYVVASSLAALHTHDAASRSETRTVASTIAASTDRANLTASSVVSAKDCVVCDLLAHLLSPEPAAPALTCAVAAADIPAPPVHPHPYRPFRFCDRSCSRAPPPLPSLA